MARHVAAEATKRGGCLLPLLVFVIVAGAIVYGINDQSVLHTRSRPLFAL